MNLYITGLNQIVDVDIDKINKPYLPIAAGDLSLPMAKSIVTLCLIASLGLGGVAGVGREISPGLATALWGSAFLGTAYSLPPFRLKRFPVLAAFCIVAVRGLVVNAGFYAHALSAFQRQAAAAAGGSVVAKSVLSCLFSDSKCFWSCLYFGIFGVVIALMKDVPDVKGDEIMNIKSFSVRVGPKVVFGMMRSLVSSLFLVTGLGFLKGGFDATGNVLLRSCRWFVSGFGFWMGWKAWKKGKDVNAEDSGEVYGYYMKLWKLFYLSYVALPFAR